MALPIIAKTAETQPPYSLTDGGHERQGRIPTPVATDVFTWLSRTRV